MDQVRNEYLRNAVLTASPEQLHLMLYDGAIRFVRQGVEGLKEKNWEQAFTGFSRAQKIVLEMLNSLNFEVDRSLCTRMAGLYSFVYQKLVDASVRREVQCAEEAMSILEYQRETWVMLIDQLSRERTAGGPPAAPRREPQTESTIDETYGALSVEG